MQLTDTQRRILDALSRPARGGTGFAPPATNQEVADEVFLSVDAIKAHLRTLYRKFEIEDLPHNQKRARLVELVLEGGYLDGDGGGDERADGGEGPTAPPARPAPASSASGRDRFTPRRRGIAAVVVVLVVLGVLALAGVFSGGSGSEHTEPAAYRAAVRGYCRLALGTEEGRAGATAALRARSYLAVIETVRGRVGSLPPPAGSEPALERFLAGLETAANFTSVVAEGPPRDGSREQAEAVAELTFAAGQVQAGALGYALGPSCVAIGDLVGRSARNAAGAP